MDKLRIGKFPFLNCAPIFFALESGILKCNVDFDLISAVPSRMNKLIGEGRVDMAPISSVAILKFYQEVLLLPQLSISAKYKVESVRLFSKVPLKELEGQTVLLTSHSATSCMLLKLLFKRYLHIKPHYQIGELNLKKQAVAGLAIGDTALKLKGNADYPYQMDLAQAWYKWTGLPFVFGLFAVRRHAWQYKETKDMYELLLNSKKWGLSHLEEMAKSYQNINAFELIEYWRTLNYDFTSEHYQSLEIFLNLLKEEGQIKEIPALRFIHCF